MSRDGFHARSHEGCFIRSVHVSDVNKGNRGVILVNQRPTALPCKTQKINNQTGCIGKVCLSDRDSEKPGKKFECSERVPKHKKSLVTHSDAAPLRSRLEGALIYYFSRVTVKCFPFDVIVFARLPAHGIWW